MITRHERWYHKRKLQSKFGRYKENYKLPYFRARIRKCPSHITLRGERVPYVIIDGVTGSTVYSCVRSIDQFARNPEYKINTFYYLNAHILAALRRVTDLIPMKIDFLPFAAEQCFVCVKLKFFYKSNTYIFQV